VWKWLKSSLCMTLKSSLWIMKERVNMLGKEGHSNASTSTLEDEN